MNIKRVLLAEDDPDTRFLLSLVLSDQGYEVVTAPDGAEALAMAGRQPPDLLIVDEMMPRMTGCDCVTLMRADPVLRGIPVVMVTAAAGLVRGPAQPLLDAVVEKPVELERFVRTVRSLCPPAERRVRTDPILTVDRRVSSS